MRGGLTYKVDTVWQRSGSQWSWVLVEALIEQENNGAVATLLKTNNKVRTLHLTAGKKQKTPSSFLLMRLCTNPSGRHWEGGRRGSRETPVSSSSSWLSGEMCDWVCASRRRCRDCKFSSAPKTSECSWADVMSNTWMTWTHKLTSDHFTVVDDGQYHIKSEMTEICNSSFGETGQNYSFIMHC